MPGVGEGGRKSERERGEIFLREEGGAQKTSRNEPREKTAVIPRRAERANKNLRRPITKSCAARYFVGQTLTAWWRGGAVPRTADTFSGDQRQERGLY